MRASWALVAFACFLAASAAVAHDRATARHNYSHHVRPIFVKYCADCHSTGGIAPMSLMTYGDASPWAAAISTEILERRMPPWQPEEGVGLFHGARYLTAKEIDIVVDWATGGTPEGDPLPAPADTAAKPEQPARRPDHVLELPPVIIPADIMEDIRCMEISLPRRPLERIAFEPGHPEMTHKAVIASSCNGEVPPLATWTPAQSAIAPPPGYAWIPAGRTYVSVQYRKTWRHDGKALEDRSRVALYFAGNSSKPIRSQRLDGALLVPADMRLLSIYIGGAQRVELDGTPILQVDRFDPSWNGKYAFKEPVLVKKGSRLTGLAWLEYIQ